MKKLKNIILTFSLALILVLGGGFFAGCGDKEDDTAKVSSYNELVSALDGNKKTIKLISDIDVTNQIVVTREVTINLNGKKLYNTADIWSGANWSIISVQDEGDLTITGNGKIVAKENDCYAVDVRDGSELTIKSGELVGNIHAVYVHKGTAEIKGGKYSVQQKFSATQPDQFVLNLFDANRTAGTAKILVTGGIFEKFNPTNCEAEGVGTNFVAEGYEAKLVEGSTDEYTVVKK